MATFFNAGNITFFFLNRNPFKRNIQKLRLRCYLRDDTSKLVFFFNMCFICYYRLANLKNAKNASILRYSKIL